MATTGTAATTATFFSYSRKDSEFAARLARDLKAAGADVWLDQIDIEPCMEWDRAVEEAVRSAPRILLILSPASVNSRNVRDEISFALQENKVIIPVLYQDCSVPLQLCRIQHVDFRADYAGGLDALLKTLLVQPASLVREEARPVEEAEVLRLKAQEAERARQAEAEKARRESEAQANAEADRKAQQEAEAETARKQADARTKSKAERRAEQEAERAREKAEADRQRKEAEAQARTEAEHRAATETSEIMEAKPIPSSWTKRKGFLMQEANKNGNWWKTLPGVMTAMAALVAAIGGLLLALHQIGLSPPRVERKDVGVVTETLAGALKQHSFEFGWSKESLGSVDRSVVAYPMEVQLTGENFAVIKYPGQSGEIRASLSGRTLSGKWRDVYGEGELEIVFDEAYSRGVGWWNYGGQTQKYNAFIRRIQ